jgi:hypothetical protein
VRHLLSKASKDVPIVVRHRLLRGMTHCSRSRGLFHSSQDASRSYSSLGDRAIGISPADEGPGAGASF